MSKMGRPTSLTPEVHSTIVKYVQAGNYVETAAKAAGVSKPALYDWLKRGGIEAARIAKGHKPRKREAPYLHFSNALKKALGEAEARDVLIIAQAASEHWQAAAWRLERKFPDRWGRRDALRIEKVKRDVEKMSDEELEQHAKRIMRKRRQTG